MTSTYVQVPPDGAGKKIETVEEVVGANTLERQVVMLGDVAVVLHKLLNALERPNWVDYGTRQVHVSLDAGGGITLTGVTTVTTVSSLTAISLTDLTAFNASRAAFDQIIGRRIT